MSITIRKKVNSKQHIPIQKFYLKTTFLKQKAGFLWSGQRDLNSRLQAWEACTLPLSYARQKM